MNLLVVSVLALIILLVLKFCMTFIIPKICKLEFVGAFQAVKIKMKNI